MRIALIVALALLLACALGGAAFLVAAGPAEGAGQESGWPGYGGGPGHAFFTPAGPSPSLYPRWWVGARGPVRGGVALVSGLAVAGSDAGTVSAVRGADGTVAWQFGPGSKVQAVPAALGGCLYVAGSDGVLYALDLDTGFPRWQFQTPSWISASPLVCGDRVLAASYSGVVSALDPVAGTLLWQASVGDDFIAASPAGDGRRVYLGTVGGKLLALDAATGAVVWRRNVGGRLEQAPALAGEVLVQVTQGEGGGVFAFDTASGEGLWDYSAPPNRWSAPVLDGYRAYLVNGDEVVGLALADGSPAFRSQLQWEGVERLPGPPASGEGGRALLAGGRLFVFLPGVAGPEPPRWGPGAREPEAPAGAGPEAPAGQGPALWALDPAGGRVLWRCPLPSDPASWPAADGTSLYVGGEDGMLYSLSPLEVWTGDRPVACEGAWPVMEAGRLWAPVRAVWEAMGAVVDWVPALRQARVGWGGRVLELEVGRGWARLGQDRVNLGATPHTVAGRLLAPLRPVAEALGVDVVWQPEFPRAVLWPRAGGGGE